MRTKIQTIRWRRGTLSVIVVLALCFINVFALQAEETQYKKTTVTTVTTETVVDPVGKKMPPVDMSDDITFEIRMDNSYDINQPVEGKILIHNSNSVAVPATFHIALYHDNSLFKELVKEIKNDGVRPGTTSFTLKEFGIPKLNKNMNYQGEWVIMIYHDNPKHSKQANFRITSHI